LKSRIAAALFNACAPGGWRAISAGLSPQDAVSTYAAPLLAGTTAAALLDVRPPTALADIGPAEQVIAIDCQVDGARTWQLDHAEPGEAMRDELSHLVAAWVSEIGR
jgi:uncharacterized lipoprotein